MSKFVISITRDDGAASADTAHTTVRIDTSTGQTRITEVNIRAANSSGLAPADLPPLDLELLVRALTLQSHPEALLAVPHAEMTEEGGGLVATEDVTTGRRGRGRRRAAGRTRGRAAKKQATKATRRRARAEGARPYRRMPDPAEVLAAYEQIGTITGLAEHFGVPRHTATAWARRLRREGHAIGRTA
jgi:hypothetical protein